MNHSHADMLWRSDAVERVLSYRDEVVDGRHTETIRLDEFETGRILAEPVVAEQDIPAHDQATMDGYAFDATDEYPLTLVDGEVYPEDEPPSIAEGEAVRIATGASLPPEANAVLKREESRVSDGELRGTDVTSGTYTYERGSNVSAGEQLFDRGERLSPKDAILLGDLGYETVKVAERFSVGVLATGTEIHEDTRRDLDSDMLVSLVRSWGHEATHEGTVPDEYGQVEDVIAGMAERYDVVLTTGGTSVGHKDYVVRALQELGTVHFHRVRVRPGKPIAAATLDGTVAFAIPGKPLGAHMIATLVVRPFFTGLTELPSVDATLQRDVDLGPEGFEYAIPVILDGSAAMPMGHADSPMKVYEREFDPSVLSSSTRATRADGFIVTRSSLSADESVDVVPYSVVE